MELALAAVIVPFLAKAGRMWGIARIGLVGLLVVADHGLAARVSTVTGAISAAREPSSIAALARRRDSMAKASMASRRDALAASAVSWAKLPMARPS
jgi:hypothetical protein